MGYCRHPAGQTPNHNYICWKSRPCIPVKFSETLLNAISRERGVSVYLQCILTVNVCADCLWTKRWLHLYFNGTWIWTPPRPLRMIWNSTLDESEHFNPTRTEFSDPRCMLMCWKTRQNAHRIKSTEWSKKKHLFLILTSPQQTFAVASLSVCTPCSKMSQCEGLFIAASLSERSWDTTAPLWHHWHNFFFLQQEVED